jgi:molybdopterin converting factor small subunit
MTVTVLVPGALRGDCDGRKALDLAADGTLRDVLVELDLHWPRLARRIRDERGEIRRFVNVYIDGDDVRGLGHLDAPVRAGAEIQVLPSVAGG